MVGSHEQRKAIPARRLRQSGIVVNEHYGPSEEAPIRGRLYRREMVLNLEMSEDGQWICTSKYHPVFHPRDLGICACWVKREALSSTKPAPPKHELPDTRLGGALAKSDDVQRYWERFLRATNIAMERGLAEEDDFVEWGGWTRSPSSDGFYFVHTEDHVRGRVYLHVPSGRMAQWHPWMGDEQVVEYLYEKQNGKCVLCGDGFRLRNLEKDHIRSKHIKRIDKIANLQLLCGACNKVKGDRTMDYAVGRLKELGVVGE